MKKSELSQFCKQARICVTLKGSKDAMLRQVHTAINNQVGYALIANDKDAEKYWKEIRTVWENFLKRG